VYDVMIKFHVLQTEERDRGECWASLTGRPTPGGKVIGTRWNPQPVWTWWRRKKNYFTCQKLGPSVQSLYLLQWL